MMRAGKSLRFFAGVALMAGVLSGCATANPGEGAAGGIYDPYERTNRKIHEFNRRFDEAVFRPASKGYTTIIPAPMLDSVNYFADNLTMPSVFVNSLAQGNLDRAGKAALRFVINSTVGFAGLADPATEFGIEHVDTDFGATLYTWGVGEGPYVELPFYGPSTVRDSIGVIADLLTNPLTFAPQRPVKNIGVITQVLRYMGQRGRYSDTVDSILYGSADSYAQARTIYLQNRRFELAGGAGGSYVDIYEDPYSATATEGGTASSLDPYTDLSLDPYAE